MAVSVEDKFSAVFMALPERDYFDIDAFFQSAGDVHTSQTAMREMREAEILRLPPRDPPLPHRVKRHCLSAFQVVSRSLRESSMVA